MNKYLDKLIQKLKDELGLFLSISFGIFLFVLFFQPFPLDSSDFNNLLLVVGGLGTIVFLSVFLIRTFIPWLIGLIDHENKEPVFPSYFNNFLVLAICSVAFAFYIHYVGKVSITFYVTFKIIIICLAAPVVLGLYDTFRELKLQNELLITEKKIIQTQVDKFEEDILNKSIEFISENDSENLSLLIGDVAYIRSADNYVEIVFREGEIFRRKLIRNTLRNVELQTKHYSNFIRCHRICIVNLHYIEKLNRNGGNHWLKIKGLDEQLPVSRQYLVKLQESI